MSSSTRSDRRRPSALAGLILGLVAAVAPIGAPAASAATGGCRAVSGAPAAAGGPQRVTVVVDTGSGAVWSACISFQGDVSGIEALELAKAQIPGLAPVYDVYAGEGRAVCRLRGVGTDPPDCLGKSIDYWGYFRNGRYWSTGAGAARVRDGDVEAWRWGSSGAKPRTATDGYEAAPYVAPTTTAAPPTTRPPAPPVTAPSTSPAPAGSGSTFGSSAGPAPTVAPVDRSASPSTTTTTTTAEPGASGATPTSTTAPATTSTAPAADAAADPVEARRAASGGSGSELAAGTPGSPGGPSLDSGDGGSNVGSIAAFAAALAAVAGAGVLVRRRRNVTA